MSKRTSLYLAKGNDSHQESDARETVVESMKRPSGPSFPGTAVYIQQDSPGGGWEWGGQSSAYRDSALRSPYAPVGVSGIRIITGIKHGTEPKAANREEALLPRSGASLCTALLYRLTIKGQTW